MIEQNLQVSQQIRYQANPTGGGKAADLDGPLGFRYTLGTGSSVPDPADLKVIRILPDVGPYAGEVFGDSDLNQGPDHVKEITEIVQGICDVSQADSLNGGVTLESRP